MNGLLPLLREAVADASTGNVGISLSGGIDSATVACLASPAFPTFTGYYAEAGFDERHWARLARHVEHHEVLITPDDFVMFFDDMAGFVRPPISGPGMFGQYMVAREASRHVQGMLSGEGSDELFGGYARLMLVAGEEPPLGYEEYTLPPGYPTDLHAALEYDYDRLKYLLATDEQMLGAWNLTGRAPFTDQRVVEYALALPDTWRVAKRHLRRAVRGVVPEAIIHREDKMGFPAPFVQWCQREPVRSFVMDRIGYVPAPEQQWSRGWWYELVEQGMPK